jgi:hypothetical protein
LSVQTSAIVRLSRVTAANTDVLRGLQTTAARLQALTTVYSGQVATNTEQNERLQRSTDRLAFVGVTLAALTLVAQSNLGGVPEFKKLAMRVYGMALPGSTPPSEELVVFGAGLVISALVALCLFGVARLFDRNSRS